MPFFSTLFCRKGLRIRAGLVLKLKMKPRNGLTEVDVGSRRQVISFKIFIGLLVICGLSACRGVEPHSRGDISGVYNQESLTGGVNDQGTPYSGFSPVDEADVMREQVPFSAENKAFASEIEAVSVSRIEASDKKNQDYTYVEVKWKNSGRPSAFKAPLIQKGKFFVSEGKDETNQRPDVTLTSICSDPSCPVFVAYLTNKQNQKAGFIVRREERLFKIYSKAVDAMALNFSDPSVLEFIKKHRDGKKIFLISTEIFPGRAYYELQENTGDPLDPVATLKGDLIETFNGTTPVQSSGKFQKLGQWELFGNSENGENIAWKLTPVNQPSSVRQKIRSAWDYFRGTGKDQQNVMQVSIYMVLTPREVIPPLPQVPRSKNAMPSGLKIHPWVTQILMQRNHDRHFQKINEYIRKYWQATDPNHNGRLKMERFLSLYRDSKADVPQGEAINYLKMTNLLVQNGFPATWGLLSIIESDFKSNALSDKGALGWWQFMPRTAQELGLKLKPVDERTLLVPSTLAHVTHFKYLVKFWDDDLMLALASYNQGEGGVKSGTQRLQKQVIAAHIDTGLREISDFSKDYWELCRFNKIALESQIYVMRFISGALVGFTPSDFGFNTRSVDLY